MERGARVERGTVVVRMMGTKSFCRKVQIGLDENRGNQLRSDEIKYDWVRSNEIE